MNAAGIASDRKQRWRLALVEVAIVVTMITLNLNGGSALAEELRAARPAHAALSSTSLADLENAFWICDHAATTGSAAADIGTCSAVYDALKERKFGGDFAELLRWWQDNKIARHAKLDEAYPGAAASERARTRANASPAPLR